MRSLRTAATAAFLATSLIATACGSASTDVTQDPEGDAAVDATPSPSPAPPPPPPPVAAPEPEPEPAYAPPEDWQERALAAAEVARAGVVAIGWRPPTEVIRRLEAGWLLAPDLVVTSSDVACEARRGSGLRVRTIDGQFRDATILEVLGPCNSWEGGVALLRLSSAVDAPTLSLRGTTPLEVGEPLLAIGHSNWSAAVGGWLVLAGPVVSTDAQWIWADIGATVNHRRFDEFFGGGSGGAPLIDLDGAVVTTLCCERDWGDQVTLRDSPRAAPLLREHLAIDEPYYVGGPSTAELTRVLATYGAAG